MISSKEFDYYEDICEITGKIYDINGIISKEKIKQICEDLVLMYYNLQDEYFKLQKDLQEYYNPKSAEELIKDQIGDYTRW